MLCTSERLNKRLVGARRLWLFLDYDGTLADFADTPEHVNPDPEVIDLLTGLGGLTGAAVASPWVFGEAVTEAENRLWLASIAGGTLVGAGIGLLTTTPSRPESEAAARWAALPYAGVVATSPDSMGGPALGGGLRGVW